MTHGFRESTGYPSSQIIVAGVALSLGARACSHTVVTNQEIDNDQNKEQESP